VRSGKGRWRWADQTYGAYSATASGAGHVGAVEDSRTGDPATGDFSDAKVVRKFGDVPDDLSTL